MTKSVMIQWWICGRLAARFMRSSTSNRCSRGPIWDWWPKSQVGNCLPLKPSVRQNSRTPFCNVSKRIRLIDQIRFHSFKPSRLSSSKWKNRHYFNGKPTIGMKLTGVVPRVANFFLQIVYSLGLANLGTTPVLWIVWQNSKWFSRCYFQFFSENYLQGPFFVLEVPFL